MIGDYYYPSGKYSLPGILFISLLLLAAGGGLQVTAVFAGAFTKSLAVEFFITAVFAGLCIPMARLLIYWGKIRSLTAARISILIFSLLLCYLHLTVFIALFFMTDLRGPANPELYLKILIPILKGAASLLVQPLFLIDAIKYLSQASLVPFFLAACLVVTVLLPQLCAKKSELPFCEQRKKWLKPVRSTGQTTCFGIDELEDLENQLEEGHTITLLSRPILTASEDTYGYLVFYKIRKQNSGYIELMNSSVENSDPPKNTPGKRRDQTFIPPIMVGQEKADELEEYLNYGRVTRNILYDLPEPCRPASPTTARRKA